MVSSVDMYTDADRQEKEWSDVQGYQLCPIYAARKDTIQIMQACSTLWFYFILVKDGCASNTIAHTMDILAVSGTGMITNRMQ